MAKKHEEFYYNNFSEGAAISLKAAKKVQELLFPFDPEKIDENLEEIHLIEHEGDKKKHEMFSELVRAFITPIERDDIMKLSEAIDNVTDSIEDIIIHIYINNVSYIRENCNEFLSLLIKCCETMENILNDFSNFKKSKTLKEHIIELNRLEEDGDKMYIKAMRDLHSTETDAMQVIAWRQIYFYFEKCFDACEEVADIVNDIVIANT